MATITVKINELKGNFIPADPTAMVGIDLGASIKRYQALVQNALSGWSPEPEVEWNIQEGEGSPPRHTVTAGDGYEVQFGEEDEILFTVDAVREKVFSQGEFWVTL